MGSNSPEGLVEETPGPWKEGQLSHAANWPLNFLKLLFQKLKSNQRCFLVKNNKALIKIYLTVT